MGTTQPETVGGAIVVVAKCPTPGLSKTRLVPMLGDEGAAMLARAMLSDVLSSLCGCPNLDGTLKVLLYAPGTKQGEMDMSSILRSLDMPYVSSPVPSPVLRTILVNNGWVLLPVSSTSSSSVGGGGGPSSSDLGPILADALDRARELLIETSKMMSSIPRPNFVPYANDHNNEAVLFLGMDSPELPMEEVVYGLRTSSGDGRLQLATPRRRRRRRRIDDGDGDDDNDDSRNGNGNGNGGGERATFAGKAHMCPANDGGYGLLSIPKHASSTRVFSGVRWSQPLTAISQLKALTDIDGVDVSIGMLMFDVDEPSDVLDLVNRLTIRRRRGEEGEGKEGDDEPSRAYRRGEGGDSLTRKRSSSSFGGTDSVVSTGMRGCFPHHTWRALIDLNVIHE